MSEEIRKLQERKNRLLQSIEFTKQKKKQVIDIVHRLISELNNREISRIRYEEKLSRALNGKSAEEWVKYYDEYLDYYEYQIKLCEKLIKEESKKKAFVKPLPTERKTVYGPYGDQGSPDKSPLLKKVRIVPVLKVMIGIALVALIISLLVITMPVIKDSFKLGIDGESLEEINKQEFLARFDTILLDVSGTHIEGVAEGYYESFEQGLVNPYDPVLQGRYDELNQIIYPSEEIETEEIEDLTIGDKQYQAVVGKPVKWKREISETEIDTIFPKGSEIKEIEGDGKDILDESDINPKLFSRKLQVTAEGYENYEIIYETPAPEIEEEEINVGKRMVVSSPDNVHYKDILSFTKLSKELDDEGLKKIKLYEIRDGKRSLAKFTSYDTDENGLYDSIEWITPALSEAVFELIEISGALHLDTDRFTVIGEIYEEVKEKDEVWSETIMDGEYVQIEFRAYLDNTRDITVYPRVVSGNPSIEVYEINSNEKIAEFEDLVEGKNTIYLTELQEAQNQFDLRVVGGSVEFDWIVDPPGTPISSCGSISNPGYYYLTQNIATGAECIKIFDGDNIVLDLNGKSMTYTPVDDSYIHFAGIWIYNSKNVTIMNGEIYDYGMGVRLTNSNESKIFNINYSINFEDAEGFIFGTYATFLDDSNKNDIENITFQNSDMLSQYAMVRSVMISGENSYDNHVKNILMKNNTIISTDPFGTSFEFANSLIGISSSDGNYIENISSLDNNFINLSLSGVFIDGSKNNFFKEINLTNIVDSIKVTSGSTNNTFLNSIYNKSGVSSDEDSEANFAWYFQTKVENSTGHAVEGATVIISNNKAETAGSFTTDENGMIPVTYLIEYTHTDGAPEYHSNYSIYAYKGAKAGQIFFNVSENEHSYDSVVEIMEEIIPLEISNLQVKDILHNSVVISWTTNKPSDSNVSYGLNSDLENNSYSSTLTSNHQIEVTGLENTTLYYYGVESCDALDDCVNISYNPNNYFTTLTETDLVNCTELNVPNTIYELRLDVSLEDAGYCFNITEPNITLNCNDNHIYSLGSSSGVFSNQINTTIRDCNFDGVVYASAPVNSAVRVENTEGFKIINSEIGGHYYGINLEFVDYFYFKDLVFSSSNLARLAIFLESSDYGVGENMSIDSYSEGMKLDDSFGNEFFNLNISSVGRGIYLWYGGNNSFYNFSLARREGNNQDYEGVYSSSSNAYFENGHITSDYEFFRVRSYGPFGLKTISFKDSTFSGDGTITIQSASASELIAVANLTNVSYDAWEILDSYTQLNRKWYYQAKVTDLGGNVDDANVALTSSQSPDGNFNINTNSSGLTNITEIIEYVRDGGTKTYYSDYNVGTTAGSLSESHELNVSWEAEQGGFDGLIFENIGIVEDGVPPNINFTFPTEDPNSILTTRNNIFVNVSSSDVDLGNNYVSTFIDFDRSLVGWWRMDDYNATGIYDNSSYDNFGEFGAGMSTNDLVRGKMGKGLEFDGNNTGDYVTIGTGSDFSDLCVDGCSFSMWAYKKDDIGGTLIGRYSDDDDDEFFLMMVSGGIPFFGIDDNGELSGDIDTATWCLAEGSAIQLNEWVYYTFVYDVAQTKIYQNGILVDSEDCFGYLPIEGIVWEINETAWQDSENTYIGTFDENNPLYEWNGTIDDVMIFNRALSVEEIAGLYADQTSKYVWNNFTNLTGGKHNFIAYAQDTSGNVNMTEEIEVEIENQAPEIISIDAPISPVLTEDDGTGTIGTIISFNFTAWDGNGLMDLPTSNIIASGFYENINNTNHEYNTQRNFSGVDCAYSEIVSAGNCGKPSDCRKYTCNVNMYYYDEPDFWSINITNFEDVGGSADNDSLVDAFSPQTTTGYYTSNNVLSFGEISPDDFSEGIASSEPVVLINTGNVYFDGLTSGTTFDFIGSNLTRVGGTEMVFADNFMVHLDDVSPCNNAIDNITLKDQIEVPFNATYSETIALTLDSGNITNNDANRTVYFCMKSINSGLPPGEYSTAETGQSWEITNLILSIINFFRFNFEVSILLAAIAIKKKKKKYKIKIPVNIFSENIGPAEILCKYLKENIGLKINEIAEVLNRDESTISINYKNSFDKIPGKINFENEGELIDISIFSDRRLSILEAVVNYLKNNEYKNKDIARILNKDQRNIWTLYNRAKQKLRKKIIIVKETKEIKIPINIFEDDIGPAGLLYKYLKENVGLGFSEIAKLINRGESTVWMNYNNAIEKRKEKIDVEKKLEVSVGIFSNRKLSVLESLVKYLKDEGYKNSEIAEMLGKDQRNIWTLYSRVKKKLSIL